MEELIEKYMSGQLSESDRAEFELRMRQDPELARQVRVQRDLVEATRISGLKNMVQKAWRSFVRGRIIKGAIIAAVASAVVLLAIQLIQRLNDPHREDIVPRFTAAEHQPVSDFQVDNTRDTVVETPGGLVLMIPANAFVTKDGEPVQDYELHITEALHPMDIFNTGLSTMSDSNLLETAGMFNIAAKSNNETLSIRNGASILAHIPSDDINPDMMLFDGEVKDGRVNWVDPKPIEKYLVTVPFDELDFYPEGYLHHLEYLKLDFTNREFTDSLYYSFACKTRLTIPDRLGVDPTLTVESRQDNQDVLPLQVTSELVQPNILSNAAKESDDVGEDSTIQSPATDSAETLQLAICPASIRAIRQPEFQHTFIATREFQERLKEIFKTCNEDYLNVYINNLDKDLWVSDSIVASMIGNENEIEGKNPFIAFARQKLGKTGDEQVNTEKLAAYFQKKREAYDQAAEKTWNDYMARHAEEERNFSELKSQRTWQINEDEQDNFYREYQINKREAYRQAGLNPDAPVPVQRTGYTVPIQRTGWKNLDVYVFESTRSRQTLSVRYNNRDVKIRYTDLEASVDDHQIFDVITCYLIPDSLRSYQEMNKKKNTFHYKLNELLRYKIVCLAQKDGSFYFASTAVRNDQSRISLSPEKMPESQIRKQLLRYGKPESSWNLEREFEYSVERKVYEQKTAQRKMDDKIRREIAEIIWPCEDMIALFLRQQQQKSDYTMLTNVELVE